MPNPIKLIVDCSTGETTEVEMTDAEVAEMQAQADAYAAEQAKRDAELQAVADAKASAVAKLAKLGLSDAEIAALIG